MRPFDPFDLLIIAFFAWYLAYVLVRTSGPFSIFARVRRATAFIGVLECMWCTILWTSALGYVLLQSPYAFLLSIPAGAGVGMFVHRYTGGDHV